MVRRATIACAIAVVVCVSVVASAAAKVRAASVGCTGADTIATDESGRQRAAAAILCTVNRVRAIHGASALRASRPLTSAATAHSAEMVARSYFSHASPDGSGVRHRAIRSGYVRSSHKTLLDETIAWGSGKFASPNQLVESFLESAPHRRALLGRAYRDLGIGLVLGAPDRNAGGPAATLTLDFGRR
ncbi:MAG: hypothetical protein QOJ89_900 [bacterium]|jgi:uncharacterized protein YkwD